MTPASNGIVGDGGGILNVNGLGAVSEGGGSDGGSSSAWDGRVVSNGHIPCFFQCLFHESCERLVSLLLLRTFDSLDGAIDVDIELMEFGYERVC